MRRGFLNVKAAGQGSKPKSTGSGAGKDMTKQTDAALSTPQKTFLDLPEALQGRILGTTSIQQRMNCIPLVCKQLADLSRRPGEMWEHITLWQTVDPSAFESFGQRDVAALQPLLAYFKTRGALTKSLDLSLRDFRCTMLVPPLFPFLEELSFSRAYPMSKRDLEMLTDSCKRLKSLEMETNSIVSDRALGNFFDCYSGLTELRLGLNRTGVLREFKEALHRRSKLQILKVRMVGTYDLMDTLPENLTELRELKLRYEQGMGVELPSTMSCLQQLKHLSISVRNWAAIVPAVSKLKSLSSLNVDLKEPCSYTSVRGWSVLSNLTSLGVEDLDRLRTEWQQEVCSPDINFPKLRFLRLHEKTLAPRINFNSASALEDLEFKFYVPSSFRGEGVTGLTSLTSLFLVNEFGRVPTQLDWPFLKHLKSLTIESTEIGSFAPLRVAQQLTELELQSIRGFRLKHSDVSVFGSLGKLQELHICQCSMFEVGMGVNEYTELFATEETLTCLRKTAMRLPFFEVCEGCIMQYEELKSVYLYGEREELDGDGYGHTHPGMEHYGMEPYGMEGYGMEGYDDL